MNTDNDAYYVSTTTKTTYPFDPNMVQTPHVHVGPSPDDDVHTFIEPNDLRHVAQFVDRLNNSRFDSGPVIILSATLGWAGYADPIGDEFDGEWEYHPAGPVAEIEWQAEVVDGLTPSHRGKYGIVSVDA